MTEAIIELIAKSALYGFSVFISFAISSICCCVFIAITFPIWKKICRIYRDKKKAGADNGKENQQ